MAAGVFGMVGSEMLAASMLTGIGSELGVSDGLAGQTVTATAAVAMLVSLIAPSAGSRIDKRVIVIFCGLLLTVSNAIAAAAANYYWMLAGRFALGVAIGGFWAISAAVTVRLVPDRMAPRALSVVFSGIAAASVLAPSLGAYLGDQIGWRNVFWGAAALAGFCTLSQFLTLPKLPQRTAARLSTIATVLRRPGIAIGIMSATGVYIVHVAFQTYLRPMMESGPGANSENVSLAFLVLGVGGMMGTLLSSVLMERSLRLTLTFMPVILGAMGLLLTLSPNGSAQQVVVVLVWGCAYGAVPVAWSLWLTRTVPDQRETASAIFVAAVQVAIAVGAGAGGLVFDIWGGTAMYVTGGLLVVGFSAGVFRTTSAAPAQRIA